MRQVSRIQQRSRIGVWPGRCRVRPVLAALVCLSVMGAGGATDVAAQRGDPAQPNDVKRSRAEMVAFMEAEVMPFAIRALEPTVGRGNVRCETCHGADAEARGWRMPAVEELPEPSVKTVAVAAGSNPQLRNALHGYLAEGGKHTQAAHMRRVVLPGMAALLHRPAYDFTQTYEVNAKQGAFGCYHCHKAGD
jgi:hypothetical protein